MQKVEFKVKVNGEEKGYVVRMPDGKLRKKARDIKTDYFRQQAFREGTVFSHQIKDLAKRKGLWSDEKDKEIENVTKELDEKIKIVSHGKSEAVPTLQALKEKIVKEIKPLRIKQLELLSERSQLDGLSIESEAQQLELDYLVSECTVTDMEERVYESLDDYKAKADEPYSEEAARKLSEMLGFTNPKWFNTLPENKLLIKYKLMNEDGNYINEQGQMVDSEGKRINAKGFYVNEKEEIIDVDGNRIDEDGNYLDVVDF
jgi:hypothetical protein